MENAPDLQPLSPNEIEERLAKLPGWNYENHKISKTFEFKSFTAGIGLLSQLAPYCDKIVHHPDVTIEYKKIRFDLNRYDIGGKVTARDFTVAQYIEDLYQNIEG